MIQPSIKALRALRSCWVAVIPMQSPGDQSVVWTRFVDIGEETASYRDWEPSATARGGAFTLFDPALFPLIDSLMEQIGLGEQSGWLEISHQDEAEPHLFVQWARSDHSPPRVIPTKYWFMREST